MFSHFSRNALWMVLSRVYHMAVSLVVSMVTARYLGPASYGLIHYAASFTALFTSLCTLGINSILVNELLCRKEEEGRILGTAIGLRLLSSLLSILTIAALTCLLDFDEPVTIRVVVLYSLSLLFQAFDAIQCWYQAHLASKTAALISGIGYTVLSGYKIWLLISGKSVVWFAAAHGIEYALVAVLLAVSYTRRQPEQPLGFSGKTGAALLGKSYHFILSGLMVAIYGQLDRVMLKELWGGAEVGYYSAAFFISSMWTFLLTAIIDAARPLILEAHLCRSRQYERWLILLYGAIVYLSFAAAAGISALSKPLILLLYGKQYLPAQGTLCILSWYTAFAYLGVARGIWIVSQGLQRYEKYIAASGVVCNLLLNALLIPLWGAGGAALATLLTQIFTNCILGFFLRDIRPNNLLICKGLVFWRYWKKGHSF